MDNHIINLTDTNFETIVLNNNKPVLVDFWAEWCGPCQMFAPILQEISQQYKETLIVSKINIDIFPNIASQYSVQSIPTLLLFKKKKVVYTHVGMSSKMEVIKNINKYLNIK
ncbi:thioredoxin [Buchnera aphidicola (Stegophylla sp.)]|uniref:Thioredoxin n=1 Tax=Buchnera aphidicola (Stegophylla sp.) TaxID=2315800 RepID=A0A4D6YLM7_9GAMM|nr:thioredoxin [Buchnera aphidicola (Stegophylla sp.)]